MKPYYDHGGITIYHGDAREVAPGLEAGAVLTDPPYGHAERWDGGTWATAAMYDKAKQWDAAPFDSAELLRLIGERAAIVWSGNYFSLPPRRCWLAWVKVPSMPTMADFELAWTSFDAPAKCFRAHRNQDGARFHATQKPVGLMRWCMGFLEAEVILDPFAGSGSTLRAAKDLGRRAIGIEIDERYCEVAANRLAQECFQWGEDGAPPAPVREATNIPADSL